MHIYVYRIGYVIFYLMKQATKTSFLLILVISIRENASFQSIFSYRYHGTLVQRLTYSILLGNKRVHRYWMSKCSSTFLGFWGDCAIPLCILNLTCTLIFKSIIEYHLYWRISGKYLLYYLVYCSFFNSAKALVIIKSDK